MTFSGDCLYLGSQSSSRQELLRAAGIPFRVLEHTSTERDVPFLGDLEAYVIAVAKDKLERLIMPTDVADKQAVFVLTADTMVQVIATGQLFGKPDNQAHALAMLAAMYQSPVRVETGCCLEKRQRVGNEWRVVASHYFSVGADVAFDVHPEDREEYLARLPHAVYCCGAGIVESFGYNFVKSISGSYAAVIGLPIFEVRQLLRSLGFVFASCGH